MKLVLMILLISQTSFAMTAKQAADISKVACVKKHKSYRKYIEAEIKQAAQEGDSMLELSKYSGCEAITDKDIDYFEDLGYRIEIYPDYGPIVIIW